MSELGDEMLTMRDVCELFGGSKHPLDQSTIYRWMRLGTFPRPVKMSPGTQRWRLSECKEAFAKMAEASGAAVPK